MTSFCRQQRFLTITQNLPSVWNYDTSSKWRCTSKVKTVQSVSMGRSKRSSLQLNTKIPGPGSYDLIAFTKSKAPNPLLIGKPKSDRLNDAPGPGSYSANSSIILTTNPKFSMTGNHFHPKQEKKPGPGDYSPKFKSISKTDPAIGFSQQKRDSRDDRILFPGPGNYNPEIKDQKSIKFSFGSEQKFHEEQQLIKQKNKVPGPGQYKIHLDNRVRSHKFISSKRKTFNDVCLPGPGDYCIQKVNDKKAAGCIIGKSERLKEQEKEIPGPKYQSIPVELYKQAMSKTAVSFSKSKKQRQYRNCVPGPGAYETSKSLIQKNGVTLKGHPRKQIINQGPGPLDYNPNYKTILNKSPCATISEQNTKPLKNISQITPGPCSYKTEDDYKVKTFFFPKSKTIQKIKDITPGPGYYSIKSQFGEIDAQATMKV